MIFYYIISKRNIRALEYENKDYEKRKKDFIETNMPEESFEDCKHKKIKEIKKRIFYV